MTLVSQRTKYLARAAYCGYKIFQGVRATCGDVTALAELGAEAVGWIALQMAGELTLLAVAEASVEGIDELSVEQVMPALEGVTSLNGNMRSLAEDMNDFSKFLTKIIESIDGASPAGAALLRTARDAYQGFMDCDRDGNGFVSRKEFFEFSERFGYTRTEAEDLFDDLDTNGDGEISFGEWVRSAPCPCDWCDRTTTVADGSSNCVCAHPGNLPLSCGMCGQGLHQSKVEVQWPNYSLCNRCQELCLKDTPVFECSKCGYIVCKQCMQRAQANG